MENYIILGIIQGTFEWLPISSEGAVAVASQFLIKDLKPIDIALFLHLGTLFAVLIYFREDWKRVIFFKDIKLLRFLIISTLVSGAIGFPIYLLFKDIVVGNTLLLIVGFALLLTAYFQRKNIKIEIGTIKLSIIVGFLQGLAVMPGFSRSGATIFGLSLGKLEPIEILKTSYMMSAPVTVAMTLYLFFDNPSLILQSWPALIFSFLVGLLTLNFLIKISNRISFFWFALVFSLFCFIGVGIGFLL